MSRHRGAKPERRYELLAPISLLSPAIDHLIETPSRQILAIEVKAGNAVRNASQLAKDAELVTQGGVLVGKNAPDVLRGTHLIIQTIERNVP